MWKRITTFALLLTTLSAVADEPAIAFVNGRPLRKKEVLELLLEAHGLEAMQQLIARDLARQEAHRRNISVGSDDIRAEQRRALDRMMPEQSEDGVKLTDEQKMQALKTILDERGLSMQEFRVGMERNAYLRKIVERDLVLTEDQLRKEFARQYGEKRQIRHIQISARDRARLQDAVARLARGERFEDVARAVSENRTTAENKGLMEPFAYTDDRIPGSIREWAFIHEPGDPHEQLTVEQKVHILRLERVIPSESHRYDDVRSEVRKKFKERIMPLEMNKLITSLFQRAKIKILDPKLRREYEELMRSIQLPGQAGG